MKKQEVTFGKDFISIEDIVAISNKAAKSTLNRDSSYVKKIEDGANFLKKVLQEKGVIYGVTTGYGDSCEREVASDLHEKLPLHLVRFHGCGLGEHFNASITRAIIAVRLCSLSQGYSGVRFELLESLETFLHHDILPLIPQEGSVGASGDLTPLSYLARALIGEEKVLYKNEIFSSEELLKKLNLPILTLKPKEGLALMNGTSVMTAIAAIAYKRAEYLAKICAKITAMASLSLKGNAFHFDELLFSVKPHKGQNQVARWIEKDLASSEEMTYQSSRLQDRYSIRCAPHVIGVLVDALPMLKSFIETEINSTNDNPVIHADKEKILHGGHFYGGHIAFAMDSLKNLVANLADLMDRQMALLVDEKFSNGLPANLSGAAENQKSLNHGLKAVQIGVSAWTAEALKNTMPASVFSRSTECHNQDKVSMGTIAARDCLRVLQLTEQVAAALLIAVRQGLEIRLKKSELSEKSISLSVNKFYLELQKDFEFLTADRPLENDLRNLVENIQQKKWELYE